MGGGRATYGSNYTVSSCSDGGPALRFSFDQKEIEKGDSGEKEKFRNYRPLVLNKNVSSVGLMIEASNRFWDSQQDQDCVGERLPLTMPTANLIRKNRLICTKREYDACI